MKKNTLTLCIASIALGLMAVACDKPTPTDSLNQPEDASTPQQVEYSYIPVNEWLPGTHWVVKSQSVSDLPDNWIQFRESYDPNRYLEQFGANCTDTLTFDDGTFSLFGERTTNTYSGEYSVVDSLVLLASPELRLYQISADSLIFYGWHDCTYTQDIQAWLFTKI